nr:translocation/assembly module TamB domain-containing protein [Methylomarinum sp. Ch1-1]MDP4519509.1 translocation/assembly module TamB domain-containing protein [Methylomarinum sp. Ch1-1]
MMTSAPLPRLVPAIIKGLAAIITLLLILLGYLIATESGTRWLLRGVFSRLDPVSVGQIDGTLIKDLQLKQLRYRDQHDFSVAIADASLRWHAAELLRGDLHIASLRLQGIAVVGQPSAGAETESSSGILQILLTIHVDEFSVKQFNWRHGDSQTEIKQLSLHAELARNILTLSQLTLLMPQLQARAHGELSLQPDWPLTADLDWSYLIEGRTLQGELAISGDMKRYDLHSMLEGPIESKQTGFIGLTGDQPQFDLHGDWQKMQWPLTGSAQVSSRQGEFRIHGQPQNYQAELNADVAAAGQPDFAVAFTGNGNQESLDIVQLQLTPRQGRLNLSGRLSWLTETRFDLAIVAEQLDTADFFAAVPGQLNLKAQTRGRYTAGQLHAALDIERLHGVLHGQPLNAQGKLQWRGAEADIERLQIMAGDNRLTAHGRLSAEQADLDLNIAAPNLTSAWPSLAGSLNGQAQIHGSLRRPRIKSDVRGHNIRYADKRIGELSLQADYQHDSARPAELLFSASDIQLADNKIARLALQAHGKPSQHAVSVTLASSLADLSIDSSGQWNGRRWLGRISNLAIELPQQQQWRLESATTLTLTPKQDRLMLDLPNSCLIQGDARLCLFAQGEPTGQLDGRLSLSAWSLTQTKPWLPDELELAGKLSAQASFSVGEQGLNAELNADIAAGKALLQDEDNVTHELPFSISTLQLNYRQGLLNSRLRFDLGHGDYLKADVNTGPADRNGVRPLSGILQAKIEDMTFIDGLLPEIRKLQGLFVADLQIGGTTQRPALGGSAQWRQGQFEIIKLGSTFHNITVAATSSSEQPDRLLLTAEVESGQGRLSGQGHLNLQAEQGYPLQLTINGEKFQISRLPEAEIEISPVLQIEKQADTTHIDGQIKIDSARIELKSIPESAVAPSDDEVIIGADQMPAEKVVPSRLNARIAIDFGDNSHFSGFGLKTRLSGKLEYTKKANQQLMQGRALMRDATYRSYGQDLTIRKGEFLFNGPPDNPWVTIEAIRKAVSGDVTAVLSVTGPLKSPQTRVYTEPALPESEALAYLLTGKSINRLSEGESNAVASAAFKYGAGQLSWLSDQLGIDEFEFEQADTLEDSAVRLGQYLNPDLYVGVSMGVFASKYAARLRYQLSEHFSVSTRAGETQRIELKYQLKTE